ncbi:MAG: NADH-quinone oxidoreductase subunit NuoG [Steroidobacteraceae bacterium]
MSSDLVNIEVDGQPLQARKGQMLIQATDAAGIYVPRFCYHEKLSVAANCRMCLVEVEKAPKPMPACATPVMEGMKAFTRSPRALAAQKATMEFLLINHPLDCPICDQGGECELQDLAQGFGGSVSRFSERKRVVRDKDIGPLVSTDMTRCIHCTRCVRFTQEVAGMQSLGTLGRGENMEIGTWIEHAVTHELSGNIIDLCPVGALNSRPFRHRARSWEMNQHPLVSPHDCVGSNLFGHVLRGELMRVVPRPNEEINETWISDRDRFSYVAVRSADRLQKPMLKSGGHWQEVSWERALEAAAEGLGKAARDGQGVGLLGSPTATTEELYLLARIAEAKGWPVDSRLRQVDFRDPLAGPQHPLLGLSIADYAGVSAALVIGSRVRQEAPILAHRLRQAAVRGGGRISFLDTEQQALHFPVDQQWVQAPSDWLATLLAILKSAAELRGTALPTRLAAAAGLEASPEHRQVAEALIGEGNRVVLLGLVAARHSAFADLLAAAQALCDLTGAQLGLLSEGPNSVGASMAGAVAHRALGGAARGEPRLTVQGMLEARLGAYLLHGGIEPEFDLALASATSQLAQSPFVVALTPFVTDSMQQWADLLLPIGTFAETSGTYVNGEGRWQSFAGCARPLADARPGWKVLRVLGNLLGIAGFDYESSEQVRDELRSQLVELPMGLSDRPVTPMPVPAIEPVGMYQVDALIRRAEPLQQMVRAEPLLKAVGE